MPYSRGPKGDVVKNAHGEGVGSLKDHPDPLADIHNVHIGVIDVLAIQ